MNENAPTNKPEEEVDMSYVDMAEGKTPMASLREAQEAGDPAKIAEAEAAADEKYMVTPELHDAHVEAKKDHDEAKSAEEMQNAFAKMEEKRKAVGQEVSRALQGKDTLGIAKTMVELYRKVTPEAGAAGWALYGEAIKKFADTLPDDAKEAVSQLADIGGNGMLRALANGEISEQKERSIARNNEDMFISSGTPEEEAASAAKRKALSMVQNRSQDLQAAEKVLAKAGVDIYNIR